jgi:hypothetical protein
MSNPLNQDSASHLADPVPTLEDLKDHRQVRELIEKAIQDCDGGRMIEVAELRALYGLPK